MNRRHLLHSSALGIAGLAISGLNAHRAVAAGGMNQELQDRLKVCTPKDALGRLQEGNERFAKAWVSSSGKGTPAQRMRQLDTIWKDTCQIDPEALSQGQKPFAAVLSCADSRVDPGWVFACASGDLFQVRCAGNTAFDDAIASLEYAISVLGTSLVVVMGHSGCGAVKAAMGSAPLTPLLEGLVKPIRASLVSGDSLTQAIQGNARYATAQLTARSTVLRDAVAAAKLSIHSAYFDIGSGRVTLL